MLEINYLMMKKFYLVCDLGVSKSLSHCFGSVLVPYQESVVSTLLILGIYRATKRRKPAFCSPTELQD